MTSRITARGLERFSLKFEIAGLVLLLIASFWQGKMSGRVDASLIELQSQIQHEVNLSVLSALSDIASLSAINDPELVKKVASSASDRALKASARVTEMTNQRERQLGGQAEWFSTVSLVLACFGAFLIIFGKFLSLSAHKSQPD